MKSYALYSSNVLLPEGVGEATVVIEGTKIKSVIRGNQKPKGIPVQNLNPLCIMPGLIDVHVHINEPGRTDWEGFDTATRAAAAGGVTSVVDMPLNSTPVTTTVAAFREKIEASTGKLHVNCGFWGGLVPESLGELPDLLESGVLGIKVFLCHSGIEDFPNVSKQDLELAMPMIAEKKLPLLVHAELIDESYPFSWEKPSSFQDFLQSRPCSFENNAIQMMIDLCRDTGCQTHIVHLSSAEALPIIEKARAEGLPFTVETCGHYLFFTAEKIPDGDCRFKCTPPIRERENRDKLLSALRKGTLDFVTSDHSPAPPEIKNLESGNLKSAWGGIGGISFTLPAVWSQENISLVQINKWLSQNPAKFLRLENEKGSIQTGYDADLVVWDTEYVGEIKESDLYFRHKISPYVRSRMKGKIIRTIVLGNTVFQHGNFVDLNCGKLVMRKPVFE